MVSVTPMILKCPSCNECPIISKKLLSNVEIDAGTFSEWLQDELVDWKRSSFYRFRPCSATNSYQVAGKS